MDGATAALVGFAALFILLLIRVPVGLSMLIAGAAGIALIRPQAVLPVIAGETFAVSSRYVLTIIPLFMLMGNLAVASGMSRELYIAANLWLGRFRGGLAAASIVACAGFSALSGSSLAAALTMGRVALPEMRRFDYDRSFAAGAVAAGGTLGILIPPSAGLVLYGILTEQSISRLFMAGLLPGVLLALLFVLTVFVVVRFQPHKAPRGRPEEPAGGAGTGARGGLLDAGDSRRNPWRHLLGSLLGHGGGGRGCVPDLSGGGWRGARSAVKRSARSSSRRCGPAGRCSSS